MNQTDARLWRDGAAYADRWLAYRREFRDLPGLAVAVRHDQDLLLSAAYGFARLEPPEPMTTRHLFRIASHSKTFTATAILQLVEQGRLRLDDRAAQHLPWLPTDVTLRQLLNHTSGTIRDGRDANFWQVEAPFPDREQLRATASGGAVLEANQAFKYSNIGYGLLGLVVEAVTGGSYNDYVGTHIIRRLELHETGPEPGAEVAERLVTGYSRARLGAARQAIPGTIDTRALSPATGFYASAEDLSRYAAAHWPGDRRLLSEASKREMQQPYWSIEQADEHYGLGFSVRQVGQRRLFGHGGGFPGQSTRTLIDPQDRLVVVVLCNATASDALAAPLAEMVVKILDFALGRPAVPEALSEAELDRFSGRFANLWGTTDIVRFGQTLVATTPEADDPVARVVELRVVDGDTLRVAAGGGYGAVGEPVRYARDGAGRTTHITMGGVRSYAEDVFRARYAT